ncbi:MAG: hypothetical protein DRO16_05590 [Thermoprotei archaeon]|nr:MAG: hypothetical protein DRO16_05590 [Thermoprotei archaeon]
MSTSISITVDDIGNVDVKFSGEHIRKLLLKRVIKKLNKEYRESIKNYRKQLVLKRKGIDYGKESRTNGKPETGRIAGTSKEDRRVEPANRGTEKSRRIEEIRRAKAERAGTGVKAKAGS